MEHQPVGLVHFDTLQPVRSAGRLRHGVGTVPVHHCLWHSVLGRCSAGTVHCAKLFVVTELLTCPDLPLPIRIRLDDTVQHLHRLQLLRKKSGSLWIAAAAVGQAGRQQAAAGWPAIAGQQRLPEVHPTDRPDTAGGHVLHPTEIRDQRAQYIAARRRRSADVLRHDRLQNQAQRSGARLLAAADQFHHVQILDGSIAQPRIRFSQVRLLPDALRDRRPVSDRRVRCGRRLRR